MIRIFLTLVTLLTFFAKTSFAADQTGNIAGTIDVAEGYNYEDTIYNNYKAHRVNAMDDYSVPQYAGPLKNKGVIPKPKFYVEGGVRGDKVRQTTFDEDGSHSGGVVPVTDSLKSTDIDPKTGYGAAFKFGLDDAKHNRYEFEMAYEMNSIATWNFKDAFGESLSDVKYNNSKLSALSFNLNYYRDFFDDKKISPYLGVGLGMTRVAFDTGTGTIDGVADESTDLGKGADRAMNYQLMLGARYKITESQALNLGYHYRGTIGDLSFATKDSTDPTIETNPYKMSYSAHIVEISYQYLFGNTIFF